uniref:Uncharacterized protein LOC100175475 n=1 Tax=Phallusia mammillata TaxID=59560 RepID=A0A6F9DGB4_9ASCI|nr:uncharacterized protein LOC100175475 [Phallusia mammillata]
MMIWSLILCCFAIFYTVNGGRVQSYEPVRNIVSGEPVSFPCATPGHGDYLRWKFQANGSDIVIDACQIYPGGIPSVFSQFDLPPGRSTIINGIFTITDVQLKDEGDYWCEISTVSDPSVLSNKYPLHVWITPQEPVVTGLHVNGSILEHTESPVARCSSKAGKPHSDIRWMNGTTVVGIGQPVVEKNSFSDQLWDISLDLVLENPTRFDHQRPFECVITHPAYKGVDKVLNYSVNVLYHPVNIRMWANVTSFYVFCEAEGFPDPKYSWILPQNVGGFGGPTLFMPNLFELPGGEFFECTADNGIPEAATVRMLVDELRYPDGKPGLLGLEWYIWVAIGGGVLLLIIIIIIVICCYKRSTSKPQPKGAKKGLTAKYSKPHVDASGYRQSQPSLLEFDHMRTPDGRESSLPPSEMGHQKANMARAYSLEHLVDEKYGNGGRPAVAIVPSNRLSRGDMYDDTSLNRRASREELDKAADHIEVLTKSWDHLAQSREHLNRSREELHVDLPPRYQSHDDLRGSRERLVEDNYPYMDDTMDRNRNDYRDSNQMNHHDQYNYDQQDGYYDDRGATSGHYDDRGYGASSGQYDDRKYSSGGGYNDQYGASSGRGYDDSTYRQDDRQYQQQQYNQQQRPSYGDSEFDDDQPDDYNRGYQPASMI